MRCRVKEVYIILWQAPRLSIVEIYCQINSLNRKAVPWLVKCATGGESLWLLRLFIGSSAEWTEVIGLNKVGGA